MNAISKVANILTSKMASAFNGSGASSAPMTITALSRWSITSNQLPAVDKIKAIHVYDFDNTRKIISRDTFALAQQCGDDEC